MNLTKFSIFNFIQRLLSKPTRAKDNKFINLLKNITFGEPLIFSLYLALLGLIILDTGIEYSSIIKLLFGYISISISALIIFISTIFQLKQLDYWRQDTLATRIATEQIATEQPFEGCEYE